ncbi:halocyanin domain-containing protein [Halobium palmae]|uniref:Halocyanin domain-containing protein n=1 Tax=Halobium palmae TaxID=1776492 RepID=A0ABD5RV20_9EURY
MAAQASGGSDFGGWFENTSNYEGIIDKTGQETVTITVGARGNNGNYAFNPAAVRVDPGTKIVWKWSGKGGVHNVVDEAGAFESEMTDEAGHTFEQTVDQEGVSTYACSPHEAMGMKGALVVGTPTGTDETGNASAERPVEPNYGDWFSNVGNYEKTVDKTGQQQVTITVGSNGNNGNFAFDPPAVRIDPGTTVVWEWSGKGGVHNVAAEDGRFESEMTDEAGHTFEQTIESAGMHKYACVPHKAMGMKGALVVDGAQGSDAASSGLGDMLAIGGGLGLVGVLFSMFALGARSNTRKHQKSTKQ